MNVSEKFRYKKGNPYILGTSLVNGGVNFAVSIPNEDICFLEIYEKGERTVIETIKLDIDYRTGNIFSVFIEDFDYKKYEYKYRYSNVSILDPYSYIINGRSVWGKALSKNEQKLVRSGFYFEEYNWENDIKPNIPFCDSILYKVHLKGFTSDQSSKVYKKGTYAGFVEKIPYLIELGITGVVLMPVYEFDEILINEYMMGPEEPEYMEYRQLSMKRRTVLDEGITEKEKFAKMRSLENIVPYRVNYWGFSESCSYFAPKTSYAYDKENAINEYKDMIKALHKAGIEVIMNICFNRVNNKRMVTDCLIHWVKNYHIDGFVCNKNIVPIDYVATEPLLADTKIITEYFETDDIYSMDYIPQNKNMAQLNDGFMVDIRKYIKGDEMQVPNFTKRFMRNPQKYATINYVSNYYGFTLKDLFSYDIKHNEENGEFNRDGTEYNYSWNCGHEGETKKIKVLKLRKKMIKNMFTVMLLSQSTPMILAGDEMCNTKKGNNNAYCQDNSVSWLNWRFNEVSMEIYDFVKSLIRIRREHPILHMKDEMRVMDYMSKGYPDISFHGVKQWYPDFSNYSRVVGIMLCGEYIKNKKDKSDNYFYFACNMHWKSHEFNLPDLPKNLEWRVLIDTSLERYKCDERNGKKLEKSNVLRVEERTIVVLMSKEKGEYVR